MFCAFRYALGRQTYIVEEVSSYLREHMDELSAPTRKLIRKEIDEALHSNGLGMQCDARDWMNLYRDLNTLTEQ